MNDRIHLDRNALRDFIDLMRRTADGMSGTRDENTPLLAGNDPDVAKWDDGIKVTLGVVNHGHAGRDAGEVLARRIGNTLRFVTSLEEGTRGLGDLCERILQALDKNDDINAQTLNSIIEQSDLGGLDSTGGKV